MSKDEKGYLGSLIEYSSVITVILLFMSISRNLAFWSNFKIDIFNYISFSEIIIYSFDIIYNYLLWLAGSLVAFIAVFFLVKKFKKNTLYVFGSLLAATIVIFFSGYIFFSLGQFPKPLASICFLGMLATIVLVWESQTLTTYREVLVFISLLGFAYLLSKIEARSQIKLVSEQMIFSGTTVYFKDASLASLVSDNNAYYIGSTKEFIFWYNKVDKSSYIIPITEVKRLTIKKQSR